ncbi:hypothetical protein A3H10_03410 [Candidatus Uhrbacteria bacterium RIFCSPLOWO2_12_FULL_46_10]|uniref:DUF1616 domain-containing protein n=1 Tax=Candidatus Uhrbacteria bacterium RIFCSPLOWO2_01_FULL_47_25 TaxID=1802402 RepID=A0A1F7UPW4_9BACT|nr:MAG: hypothetical protein UX68_C0020G0004 [Parcubacteria group bacterium GW2011_GWA2_46_9]OGL61000.1 MAG: hypothetical protein A2752_00710 [Candidatus Uhrbacteria bacterium RIFCSPHIGHO2_01_FULL_46_23]OGL69212.1 MAG: hypothetical protein A3D60_04915 [Candidatus Uhrbacteria bacterium RIFCSPHIGHO2_02_FULL_47_29]OGL80275.1 MAG: hypothetical protein A2936_02820 [Candidatus Uhrbacteria bacterium RIFCSPLOWO2_01_FULL_47_25]OGL85350.1 MAG: hypothetical protein A3I37_00725 [Candidatus Uhrbacteria bact
MSEKIKKNLFVIGGIILSLLILSAALSSWLPFRGALRIVFGTVFMLFLPGFFIIELAFPRHAPTEEKQLDWIERFTLSFALSIAVVPLIVYFLNKAGVAITARNIFLEVASFIIVLLVVIIFVELRKKSYTKRMV